MLRNVLVAALAASASAAGAGAWNYDRCDRANGPMHWPSNNGAFCGAQQQSPIDLCGAVPLMEEADKYKLDFLNAADNVAMTLQTDGQAKLIPPTTHSYTANAHEIPKKIGRSALTDNTWKFAQAHFHWGRGNHVDEGSEHYIEGVQHPLEIHLVHHNTKYTDLTAALASGNSDALMVVGQFYSVDDSVKEGGVMSAEMVKLASAMAKGTRETTVTNAKETTLNMSPYGLVDQTQGFYTYPGSLTTPTCNPVVTWIVMNQVSAITSSVLDHFQDKTADGLGHKAAFGNFRPLAAKGDRTVYYSKGHATAAYIFNGRACSPYGARQPVFPCPASKSTGINGTTMSPPTVGYGDKSNINKSTDEECSNTAAIVLGVFFGIFLALFLGLALYTVKKQEQQQLDVEKDSKHIQSTFVQVSTQQLGTSTGGSSGHLNEENMGVA